MSPRTLATSNVVDEVVEVEETIERMKSQKTSNFRIDFLLSIPSTRSVKKASNSFSIDAILSRTAKKNKNKYQVSLPRAGIKRPWDAANYSIQSQDDEVKHPKFKKRLTQQYSLETMQDAQGDQKSGQSDRKSVQADQSFGQSYWEAIQCCDYVPVTSYQEPIQGNQETFPSYQESGCKFGENWRSDLPCEEVNRVGHGIQNLIDAMDRERELEINAVRRLKKKVTIKPKTKERLDFSQCRMKATFGINFLLSNPSTRSVKKASNSFSIDDILSRTAKKNKNKYQVSLPRAGIKRLWDAAIYSIQSQDDEVKHPKFKKRLTQQYSLEMMPDAQGEQTSGQSNRKSAQADQSYGQSYWESIQCCDYVTVTSYQEPIQGNQETFPSYQESGRKFGKNWRSDLPCEEVNRVGHGIQNLIDAMDREREHEINALRRSKKKVVIKPKAKKRLDFSQCRMEATFGKGEVEELNRKRKRTREMICDNELGDLELELIVVEEFLCD